MSDLASRECVPCRGGVPPLAGIELEALAAQISQEWRVVEEHHLERKFTFPDFRKALEFTNQVGELAEEQNHHPEIRLSWGWVKLLIWTHKIDGLTESDFVWAAKAEELYNR